MSEVKEILGGLEHLTFGLKILVGKLKVGGQVSDIEKNLGGLEQANFWYIKKTKS